MDFMLAGVAKNLAEKSYNKGGLPSKVDLS
jgi:hypothetical protein